MAEICCGVVSESEASAQCETSSRVARRRRMEIRRYRFVAGVAPPEPKDDGKRQRVEAPSSRKCENAVENCACDHGEEEDEKEEKKAGVKVEKKGGGKSEAKERPSLLSLSLSSSMLTALVDPDTHPRFGVASVCGRRRDMEDAVAIRPSFCSRETAAELHFFGVYDGHGCSHVAMRCRERLHELVKEEVEAEAEAEEASGAEWKGPMERSFWRMDKEAEAWNEKVLGANCRCEMQTPECDAVGSTAVVAILTPDKIVVSNCGDSRAVLCRNGKAVPLSSDHKPDRPDELERIQAAGGRVIYWDGPRVLGVLAMSRAIGDNYLKPYVSCQPEVTITDRSDGDECLILASDGLWDVVSNDTACGVARVCLKGKVRARPCLNNVAATAGGGGGGGDGGGDGEMSDEACSDASMLLTKLALARHSSDNVSVIVVDLRRGR